MALNTRPWFLWIQENMAQNNLASWEFSKPLALSIIQIYDAFIFPFVYAY